MIQRLIKKLSGEFVRDAFALTSSSVAAQIISLIAIPILTRIYAPDDFGMLSLYMAIYSYVSLVATVNLEYLVMMADSDRKAAAIVSALMFLSAVVSVICGVLIFVFGDYLSVEVLNQPEIRNWLYFLPITTLTMSCYLGFRYMSLRQRRFKKVAIAYVAGISAGSVVSLLYGLFAPDAYKSGGLIIGYILQVSVFFYFLASAGSAAIQIIRDREFGLIVESVLRFKKLLQSGFIARIISTIYLGAPVFFISAVYGVTMLGFYSTAERLASAPGVLISRAIGDVYRQRATSAWQTRKRFDHIFVPTLIATFCIGVPVYILGIIFAPDLFEFVLGADWRRSGELASIILVGAMVSFITSPLDKGATIREKHGYIIGWQAARLCFKALLIGYCYVTSATIETFLWLLIISRTTLYSGGIFCEYIWSRGDDVLSVLGNRTFKK